MYSDSKAPAMAYDRAITVFSPEGKLYQVEYAAKIIEKGTPALALRYKDGIVFLADLNFESKLLKAETLEKIFKVDDNIYFISAGMAGDARKIVDSARDMASENKMFYSEGIDLPYLARRVGAIKQAYTQYGGARPYGVSFIIAGKDNYGYYIFETDPSGSIAEYKALAIGRNRKKIMDYLEKHYEDNLSEKEAVKLAISALKASYDKKKFDNSKLKIGLINEKGSFVLSYNDYK